METAWTGDDLDYDVPLVDGDTEEPVPAADVAEAWLHIGDLSYTLGDGVLSVVEGFLQIRIPDETSRAMDPGYHRAYIKVRRADGKLITIIDGAILRLKSTPLTDRT